jgi:hypothetical protein
VFGRAVPLKSGVSCARTDDGGAPPQQHYTYLHQVAATPTQPESGEEEGRRTGSEEQQQTLVGRKKVCFSVTILDASSTVTGLFIGPHTHTSLEPFWTRNSHVSLLGPA